MSAFVNAFPGDFAPATANQDTSMPGISNPDKNLHVDAPLPTNGANDTPSNPAAAPCIKPPAMNHDTTPSSPSEDAPSVPTVAPHVDPVAIGDNAIPPSSSKQTSPALAVAASSNSPSQRAQGPDTEANGGENSSNEDSPSDEDDETGRAELKKGLAASTWAKRNPEKPVIEPRQRKKKTLTYAEKATEAERKRQRRVAAEGLEEDICSLQEEIAKRTQEIADKWGKKFDAVRTIVQNNTTYKGTTRKNVFNTVVHHLKVELNKSTRVPGSLILYLLKREP